MLFNAAKYQGLSFYCFWVINPNKAGLFEGSFSWGAQFDALSYFKKNLSNFNKTLYNC